jgi:hypothetical protein
MNIKLVIRMGMAALWYVDSTKAALDQQKGVEGSGKRGVNVFGTSA